MKSLITQYKNLIVGLLATVFLISLALSFKINDSSVGMFCHYVPIGCDSGEVLFESRPIRSDEWLVGTPYLISDQLDGDDQFSTLVGESQAISPLTGSAINHWNVIFRPFILGQFFLDVEHAYSLLKISHIAFFIFIWMLLLRIFRVPMPERFILSLAIFFTPFIQWWSAYPTIAYPISLLVLFYSFIDLKVVKPIHLLFYSLLGILLLSMNLHQLYPPYQIPMFLLLGAVCFGLIVHMQTWKDKKKMGYGLAVLILSLITSVMLFYLYADYNQVAISAIQNSSYPGQRISAGGDFQEFRLLSGFYDIQLLNNAKPMGPYNQSEAASFLNIFIFLLPIIMLNEIISRIKHKRNDWLAISIIGFILFIAGWMFIGYPDWFSKVSLLNRVPANRAQIGLGVAGIMLTAYYVYSYKIKLPKNVKRFYSVAAGVISTLIILYVGLYLKENYPTYISNTYKIILLSGFAGLIIFLASLQIKRWFAICLLGLSLLLAGSVHPLRTGLDPIKDSQFVQQVKEINNTQPARWAVYNNAILSPLLYANGIQSATGIYLYPQASWWLKFDKNGQYKEIWNRYAHVYFSEPSADDIPHTIIFRLVSLDSFALIVDPCNPTLDQVNIRYLASVTPINSTCVREIPKNNFEHDIYIYERWSDMSTPDLEEVNQI